MTYNKKNIIGKFVNRTNILSYLEQLKNDFKIYFDKIYIYIIDGNENEYLVTFKAQGKYPYIKDIEDARVFHTKNGCLFTINALNRLIEEINGRKDANFVINWDEYNNKLIILAKDTLKIKTISKIDDKCVLLSNL